MNTTKLTLFLCFSFILIITVFSKHPGFKKFLEEDIGIFYGPDKEIRAAKACAEDEKEARDKWDKELAKAANNAIAGAVYVQDKRTGLCFLAQYGRANTIELTCVPCTSGVKSQVDPQ